MLIRGALGERGFTLSELLVGISVLALLMAGLVTLLGTGQQSFLLGANQIEAANNARLALYRLTHDIRSAGYDPTTVSFAAITAQTTTGFTAQNDWNGNGTIQTAAVAGPDGVTRGERVTYTLVGPELRRQEIGIDATAVVLVAGIQSLSFAYRNASGTTATTDTDIRSVVVSITVRPDAQPGATSLGRTAVSMADTIRLRNRER